MGSDLEILKSHPNKLLLDHIQGVRANVRKLTNSKIAELVAIFHDLGKMNPNFQAKLEKEQVTGYSNHSYLSAYAFFCAFTSSNKNTCELQKFLDVQITRNDLIALTVLIAKHHGNIPDFSPIDHFGAGVNILANDENKNLYAFLDNHNDIPIYDFASNFFQLENFLQFIRNKDVQLRYAEKLKFRSEKNIRPLDFFLDYQFAFASVVQADKADAGEIGNIIDKQINDLQLFSNIFSSQLDSYLNKLNQDSALNKLRTTIRNHAISNIQLALQENERIFELTAPTGSGKTLMLLSLASEIIKKTGVKKIIYALPFLSITEQVDAEIVKIFAEYTDYIQRVDSKSENHRFETLQKELENEVTAERLHEVNILEFIENTFAYPLIITTFVRFFETLLSNRNSELLKLPNFSNCIFLIDEIQALPPRLYGFFVAYIKKFCQKFNSYAIISTATQPNFKLPEDNKEAKDFFYDYSPPKSLLPLSYFENDLFNRYQIHFLNEKINSDTLKEQIISENSSVLVILNTIDDTKDLFEKLKDYYNPKELLLLNTHFTPRDRKLKIYLAKRRLRQNKRVIVISTQLIEAGVDIDFPVLYRDFATIASIVQSAGRCNRNGKLPHLGKVVLFKLEKNNKIRAEIIYQGKDKDILTFTKQALRNESYQEKELLQVQQKFFDRILSDLNFAKHSQDSPKREFDFLKDIEECMFEKIGKFQLIDKKYGDEKQYYVPKNGKMKGKMKDERFEELLSLHHELVELLWNKENIYIIKNKKKEIELKLRKMSNQIVQIRLKKNQEEPLRGSDENYFSLYKIDYKSYSFENGIDLAGSEFIF
ncbi:MAG: CRISPR-associated helicase Cas3' [Prevotellaceae bacterium]|jgi:CRISPR-associated endonuclease/helicase Cas3|nr:CRISPR-associated helicase Cas3' [Prevotellaceae bacterium]